MRRTILAVVLFVALIPGVVTPGRVSRGQSQHALHVAASDGAREADRELARVHAELVRSLDEESSRELVAADRAFERYRDAEVALEAGLFRGGSLEPTEACAVRSRLTRERVRTLSTFLAAARDR